MSLDLFKLGGSGAVGAGSAHWLRTLSDTEEVKSSKFLMSPEGERPSLGEPSLGEAGALRGQITPWAFLALSLSFYFRPFKKKTRKALLWIM